MMAQPPPSSSSQPPPSPSSATATTSTTTTIPSAFIKPPTSFYKFQPRPPPPAVSFQNPEYDGKRLRKAVARKTVDYNSSIVKMLESRIWQRDQRDYRSIQPDVAYYTEIVPPMYMLHNPANCITTKFVRTSTNKMRCPIFCVLWTPEGRRLITGSSSGEFTLWNGLTFNFETILQAHDTAVKVMVWSKNDSWMVTGDQNGYVKYWQSNMNNVKMFQAHKEPVRAISFCPTDTKFATCSDDGTIRIWDFFRYFEERILRGHGADVKGVDWHPTKALIASGSKDSQQPVKLWDPKTGQSLATLHAHKNTVTDIKWNHNGNWLLTSSRDHLIKIYDIRNMTNEMQTFRGHKKEVSCLSWHPLHEGLFASGGSDGSILFWLVGTDKEIGGMENAHESIVWSLSWHPLGHILTSGSNDHTCKFWTRNRPGDKMRDRYNLNLLPKGAEECEDGEDLLSSYIPEMGYYDRNSHHQNNNNENEDSNEFAIKIPGFGFDENYPIAASATTNNDDINESNPNESSAAHQQKQQSNDKKQSKKSSTNTKQRTNKDRKQPYSRPISKKFQQQWNNNNSNNDDNTSNNKIKNDQQQSFHNHTTNSIVENHIENVLNSHDNPQTFEYHPHHHHPNKYGQNGHHPHQHQQLLPQQLQQTTLLNPDVFITSHIQPQPQQQLQPQLFNPSPFPNDNDLRFVNHNNNNSTTNTTTS